MPYDVHQLLEKSDADLAAMFASAQAGPIPNGPAEGTAIVAAGTKFSPAIAKVINLFAWQGKTFNRVNDQVATLRNRITFLGIDAIVAEVYFGPSLIDNKQCIVLDYSKTSTVAERVRDEIRLIAEATYLGRVYWDNKPTIYFALQFAS